MTPQIKCFKCGKRTEFSKIGKGFVCFDCIPPENEEKANA